MASLYSIQGYVLDQLANLGTPDVDGFGEQLAQLYLAKRAVVDDDGMVAAALKIRTGTFAARRGRRGDITRVLIERLDFRFLKEAKRWGSRTYASPRQAAKVKELRNLAATRKKPIAFAELLREYQRAIQLHGVNEFWESRSKGTLRRKPESLAQHSLTMFLSPPTTERRGFLIREIRSGTGFVDILLVFGARTYLLELKVTRSNGLTGLHQLANYCELHSLGGRMACVV